jgi:hypothetical protein
MEQLLSSLALNPNLTHGSRNQFGVRIHMPWPFLRIISPEKEFKKNFPY